MNRFVEMETFIQVVDSGSISGAADRLDTAKSAVSRRLAGGDFYERCKTILADVAAAEQCVSATEAELKGTLRVAAPLSFGISHLGPAISDFLERHPDVAFDLDFNDRRIDLVEEGFDLAIRIAKLQDSSLMARRLTPIRNIVCASRAYWDEHGRPTHPDELRHHRALRYGNIRRRGWPWTGPGGDRGSVNVPVRLTANNGEYLAQAATAGFGVIRTPAFIIYKHVESGDLEPVLQEYRWGDIDAFALYPRTRHVSQLVRSFIDFLAERFGDTPYWELCLERR
jgi:DNA-binding transcriptional LysR family regulator